MIIPHFTARRMCTGFAKNYVQPGLQIQTKASDLFVFISNDKKQIPLWHQKASHRADGVILWDYHVICIQKKENVKSPQVWDLDSNLPFPSPLASYVAETFRQSFPLFSEF